MQDEVFNIGTTLIAEGIGGFEPGMVFAVASRPHIGKTHFCIRLADIASAQNKKVLYISDTPSEAPLLAMPIGKSITLVPSFCLDEYKLAHLLAKEKNNFLVIDPFDTFSLNIDCGRLKEIAVKKGICILLTKHLSRPPFFSRRKRPVLSDIKFTNKKATEKFIAYTDVILFLHKEDPAKMQWILAKNIQGSLTTIELPDKQAAK